VSCIMRKLNSSILRLAGHVERDQRTAENSGTGNIPEKASARTILCDRTERVPVQTEQQT
jgi:hypothetical protein